MTEMGDYELILRLEAAAALAGYRTNTGTYEAVDWEIAWLMARRVTRAYPLRVMFSLNPTEIESEGVNDIAVGAFCSVVWVLDSGNSLIYSLVDRRPGRAIMGALLQLFEEPSFQEWSRGFLHGPINPV